MTEAKLKLEYGDYQTPDELASHVCRVLGRFGIRPKSLVEPTCGVGGFLKAGVENFLDLEVVKGFEVNQQYIDAAKQSLGGVSTKADVSVNHADFFQADWSAIVKKLPEPILFLGNPPWVTNAALGMIGGSNLPTKSNFQGHAGLDAVTGKGNFDISEYMLIRLCEELQGKEATLAMLCKTAVARKVMAYCWRRDLQMGKCQIFPIDAMRNFGAAVEACLFVGSFNCRSKDRSCLIYNDLATSQVHTRHMGYKDGSIVSDVEKYERWSFLRGKSNYTWRSGVKHDCAKVMEFAEKDGRLVNGLGESVQIEETFLFTLLKSSAVAGSVKGGKRKVLVTQKNVGDETSPIAQVAPRTWDYLLAHADLLDKRASIIYRKRPRFCVFGVGEYSFAPWKVVISGFYRKLEFRVVGPDDGRPVMLDDTAYFLSCSSEPEARLFADLLNSDESRGLLSSLIFWDSKRPITVEVLSHISLEKLALHLGRQGELSAVSNQLDLSCSAQAELFTVSA
jgi:hypothetical protein